MTIALRPLTFPRGLALAMLAVGLLLPLVIASVGVGSRPTPHPAVTPTTPATNGLIAFDHAGDIYVVRPDGTGLESLIDTGRARRGVVARWIDDRVRGRPS